MNRGEEHDPNQISNTGLPPLDPSKQKGQGSQLERSEGQENFDKEITKNRKPLARLAQNKNKGPLSVLANYNKNRKTNKINNLRTK